MRNPLCANWIATDSLKLCQETVCIVVLVGDLFCSTVERTALPSISPIPGFFLYLGAPLLFEPKFSNLIVRICFAKIFTDLCNSQIPYIVI